jgi:hypothetical protein
VPTNSFNNLAGITVAAFADFWGISLEDRFSSPSISVA